MEWVQIKKELLSDPATKREYDALAAKHAAERAAILSRIISDQRPLTT